MIESAPAQSEAYIDPAESVGFDDERSRSHPKADVYSVEEQDADPGRRTLIQSGLTPTGTSRIKLDNGSNLCYTRLISRVSDTTQSNVSNLGDR